MEDAVGNSCELEENTDERDLAAIKADDFRWKGHINTIMSKANGVSGMLKRAFICRNPDL